MSGLRAAKGQGEYPATPGYSDAPNMTIGITTSSYTHDGSYTPGGGSESTNMYGMQQGDMGNPPLRDDGAGPYSTTSATPLAGAGAAYAGAYGGGVRAMGVNPLLPKNQHKVIIEIRFGGVPKILKENGQDKALPLVIDRSQLNEIFKPDHLKHFDKETGKWRDPDMTKAIITEIEVEGYDNPFDYPLYVKSNDDTLNQRFVPQTGRCLFDMHAREKNHKRRVVYKIDTRKLDPTLIEKYGHVDLEAERRKCILLPRGDRYFVDQDCVVVDIMKKNPEYYAMPPGFWDSPDNDGYVIPSDAVESCLLSIQTHVLDVMPKHDVQKLAFSACRACGVSLVEKKGSCYDSSGGHNDGVFGRSLEENKQGRVTLIITFGYPRYDPTNA